MVRHHEAVADSQKLEGDETAQQDDPQSSDELDARLAR
jgi:hypothetical protein